MLPSLLTQFRRITEIAEDVENQLSEWLSESLWQVDESTDAKNPGDFTCIYQDDFQEDLVCFSLLPTKTTQQETVK